jgi:hypothetical protein
MPIISGLGVEMRMVGVYAYTFVPSLKAIIAASNSRE